MKSPAAGAIREGREAGARAVFTWSSHPVIYEINTWVWLGELSRQHGRVVDLGSVPNEEWDAVAAHGCDAVWFMGVWERSPAGVEISMRNRGLLEDFRRALPDFSAEDNVGSPYCVRRYVVDERLGGPEGLAAARENLAGRGIGVILDFVPNHVAPDHMPGEVNSLVTWSAPSIGFRSVAISPEWFQCLPPDPNPNWPLSTVEP